MAVGKLSQDPPLLGFFVPKCKPDGQYEDKQCHELYCWCVDKDGQKIPGTDVRGNYAVCHPGGKTSSVLIYNSNFIVNGELASALNISMKKSRKLKAKNKGAANQSKRN